MTTVGMDWHANRPDLLVADAGWDRLLVALGQTSGERFVVLGLAPQPWWTWMYSGKAGDEWPLLAGDHEGRSYVLAEAIGVGGDADRVATLTALLGAVVLGYSFEDTTATQQLTVARGHDLLRNTLYSNWGNHEEGAPLPGEDQGIGGVLQALGFDPDGWLQRGTVLRVAWTPLDHERDAEAHRRLYFGPLRMRVDHIQQAALEEFKKEAGQDADTDDAAP
jgi:hypothetical protein